jgi:hypothetical protein
MAVGCAATPERFQFVRQEARLTAGRNVDLIWTDSERIARKTYLPLALGPISTRYVQDQKGITAAEAESHFRDAILQKAKEANLPLVVDGGEASAPARLELAITEMYPGGRVDRIMNGEFGAGHAWVQVEGRVVDAESGEELAAFADRRRSSAWIGLRDVFRNAGPVVVREMLEGIAGDIVSELDAKFVQK